MTTLREIEKHVLDDAVELIASVGLGNPLMHSTAVHQMAGDRREIALFLRGLLGRHVILVATRLHEPNRGLGQTGYTASIESYLDYARAEGALSLAETEAFRSRRQAIIKKLEVDGATLGELVTFRHSELAHSLHPKTPMTNPLASLPIWDFADATFHLVQDIENAVSGTGRLNKEFQIWLDRGHAFWPESGNDVEI